MESTSLNKAQLTLLELLSEPLTEAELERLRKMLVQFRYDRLQELLNKQWKENNWTQATLDEWYQEHHRTPYPREKKEN